MKNHYMNCVTILTLNYLYFWLDLELHAFSMLCLSLTIIGFLVSLFSIKITLKEIFALILSSLVIQIIFTFLAIIYGEQFYFFRGNIHDNFAYLTSGMMFNNYSYNDLLLINNENFINNLNEEFYLIKSLKIIQARPSVQL